MNKKLKYLITAVLVIVMALGISVTASAETAEPDLNEADTTVFDKIYAEVGEYASEMLCAMAFIGSVILAFAYKKGLLPLVKASLVSIGNAVGKMKDSVSRSTEMGEEFNKNLVGGLENATTVLDSLAQKVDALEYTLTEKLSHEGDHTREKEALGLILTAQIDMLYDVFMCSALPQYQKDAIGERIAAMKGALKEYGDKG